MNINLDELRKTFEKELLKLLATKGNAQFQLPIPFVQPVFAVIESVLNEHGFRADYDFFPHTTLYPV